MNDKSKYEDLGFFRGLIVALVFNLTLIGVATVAYLIWRICHAL